MLPERYGSRTGVRISFRVSSAPRQSAPKNKEAGVAASRALAAPAVVSVAND